MSDEELIQAYDYADEHGALADPEEIRSMMAFKILLGKHLGSEFDITHYELLRRRKTKLLYQVTRAEFCKRPTAEKYLLGVLKTEKSPEMQADILQILGHIRSVSAVQIAKEYLTHDNNHHREVALFVLGWMGTQNDVALLQKHMCGETDPWLRITAASAHRQIAWHRPEIKKVVLKSLKVGFECEKSDEVLPWIIIMISTIAVKNLGLREDKEDPDKWHGDLQRAKKKTAEFLQSI